MSIHSIYTADPFWSSSKGISSLIQAVFEALYFSRSNYYFLILLYMIFDS